jgi:hypothetical protein
MVLILESRAKRTLETPTYRRLVSGNVDREDTETDLVTLPSRLLTLVDEYRSLRASDDRAQDRSAHSLSVFPASLRDTHVPSPPGV